MSDHSVARTTAEMRFDKMQRQAEEGAKARAEDSAKSVAVTANTARLKALRLDKERADKEAAALVPPPAPKARARAKTTKTV